MNAENQDGKEKNQSLGSLIRKAGKAQRTLEFKCPYVPDFFVNLTYTSKFVLNQLREISREVHTNLRTREKEERLNDDKLRKAYAQMIIRGWRGLTAKKLLYLLPDLEVAKEDLEKDIVYTQEICVAILESSLEFEAWVIDVAMDLTNFQPVAELKEKEYENLK